ncbi:MAG: OmpA family protein [Bacteroidia bacterium]|nr:OmpA family protein [Bacteroidia bacterium]
MKTSPLHFILSLSALFAQQYFPFAIGHSAGVLGAQINPASIADSRYRFDLLFFGTSLNLSNNYVGARRELLTDFIRYGGDFPDTIDFQKTYLVDDYQNTSLKQVRFEQQVLLPSFLLTLGRRSAIALNLRLRNRFSLNNVDYRLAKLAYESLEYPPYWRQWIDAGDLSFQYATYYDIALTYARVLVNSGRHLLKGGLTLRYLHGVYGAYFYVDQLRFRYQFYNDDSLAIQDGSRFYWGHAKDFDYDIYTKISERPFDNQTRFSLAGDVGLIYEFRPRYDRYVYDMDGEVGLERRDRDRYTLRLGVALQDIRSRMRFVKGPLSNQIEITQNRLDQTIHEWNLRPVRFRSVRDFNDTLRNRFGIADSNPDFILRNQIALNLSLDWHIGGPLYLGGLGVIPFGKDDLRLRTLRFFSIYPRLETPVITLGIPFTINEWGDRLWGAAVKIGPFVVGTNSLNWVFGQPTLRTVDFYFMFKSGIPYRRPRDRDKDGVSDKRDMCPTVGGLWAFQGCPDSDGDHIPDKDDVCPLDPGVPKFQGCPDADGDDIPDKEDACPTESGVAKFKGCPDRDGDDVPDKDDICPDEKGLPQFRGCPDSDGDGIPDKEDECPAQAGLAAFKGCPDSDGDGIPDKEDACPNQAGLIAFKGCPDTDRDGIPDAEDRCPDQPGPAENKGCPFADQDRDGVLDKDDDCPFTPGTPANRGCPEIPKEQKRILDMAFRNLEFETAKAIIRPRSLPYLDTLAMLLIDNPTYKLKISGHTDNQGTLEYNMKLSKARAEAVRNYLVSQGVSADRFIVEYFGPLRPIASNATPQGRARNRRVEMKVVFD